jgi:hypothetical protein
MILMKGNLISWLVQASFIAERTISRLWQKIIRKSEQFLKFTAKFHCLIKNEGLSSEQTYNCDKTGLSYKMLP